MATTPVRVARPHEFLKRLPTALVVSVGLLVDRVQRLIPSAIAGMPSGEVAKVGTICQTRSTSALTHSDDSAWR